MEEKQKLIHTELLSKYDHCSSVGFATASHLEYCRWCYEQQKEDFYKDFSAYLEYFCNFFKNFAYIIMIPLAFLTRGFIFYPIWIFHHKRMKKKLIKELGVKRLNRSAKDLLKRIKAENE